MSTSHAVHAPAKVLVTGANGYIAAHVIQVLLERGYSVRGTLRSEGKGGYLKRLFQSYGEKFEIAVLRDLTQPGAFDQVIKGCDAVLHIASPIHLNAGDPKEIIEPAVKATTGVIESVIEHGSSVKRVIITASAASVIEILPYPSNKVFDETCWNEQAIMLCETQGKDADQFTKYRASKTLAEKAAWKLYEEHKSEGKWDLVVLNPPFVFGRPIHEINAPSELNESLDQFYKYVVKEDLDGKDSEFILSAGSAWVDVRDLANAHVDALSIEEAGGNRFITSIESFVWQDWIDVANSLDPSPIPSHKLPKGFPDGEKKHRFKFDASKSRRVLNLKIRTKEETAREVLSYYEERGW